MQCPRKLIPGRVSPRLADKSKVFLKKQPSRMLLPWVQLGSSSVNWQENEGEKEENSCPPFLCYHQKSLLRGTDNSGHQEEALSSAYALM